MQHVYAIVLAGGTGSRMGFGFPKQFIEIDKLPIIIRTIKAFHKHTMINGIVVVIHPDYIEWIEQYKKEYGLDKIVAVIPGGETRQMSSYNALWAYNFTADDILLFHDAARPFINGEIISICINETIVNGATGVCVRTTDTIIEGDEQGFIKKMPDRKMLWNAQTPQGFRYSIIREAHEAARQRGFTQSTDDVRLVLDNGWRVKIVSGSYDNIKITNSEDIIISEAIARKYPV